MYMYAYYPFAKLFIEVHVLICYVVAKLVNYVAPSFSW